MKPGENRSLIERFAFRTTGYIGSPASLVVHTALFCVSFALPWFGVPIDRMLLVLTTILSLEAIYLSIFIQMTVNRHSEQMEEVSEDVEEISEDVGDIQENVEEISKDIDDIQEDVEEISEEIGKGDEAGSSMSTEISGSTSMEKIETALLKLLEEVRMMKKS